MISKDNISSFKRLNIDRKMVGILSLFTVLGICLVIIITVATDTMSALRAYSSLQTHWTEQRKEAVYRFTEYVRIQDEATRNSFYNSLEMIDNLKKVREELYKQETDRELVRKNLLSAQTPSADIDNMISTFKRFHSFPDFTRAINAWIESDRLLGKIRMLAGEVDKMNDMEPLAAGNRKDIIASARELDRQLTEEQYRLASALSDGTAFVTTIVLWISLSLGAILLFIGSSLSVRFLKSIKQWKRVMEFSEQRYRSLYERNPNAVFSVSTDGWIIQGNQAMKQMTGFDEESKDLKIAQLFVSEQRKRMNILLEKAVNGEPQRFETKWVTETGKLLPVYITYLPIYIHNKIDGVFGIAEDISFQKEAENRIKQQLEEKTFLLSEIHDRVKNNLALISGLIELQKQNTEDESALELLESTKARIHSMAMVHERLYQVESFANIRMDEYVRDLVTSLKKSFDITDSGQQITINADAITLAIKRAIPCGLLLNELIINAFKYVLHGSDDGRLSVELKVQNDKKVHIRVKDNGEGLGPDFDIEKQDTLGMTLIRLLVKQLNISMEINVEEGTEFNLYLEEDLPVLRSA